ncbi:MULTISPECIES: hypothetical protein [unclassified Ruegeria]|uniref:hypothetical protein n=1 Tax=unclassified Ruegeria TaxID=2625375 RepID=UPI001487C922|nr:MULTISPECIES: hypothetical protein [unclassified Ruegeria]NOD35929.1 hypothetical protein [Ruegeria sp. HKCCD7296]NOE43321.1 hypothetical protein [Ruegeria sp. HKCCD7319]
MKTLTFGLAFAVLASQAVAQQTLSLASPIPDGAETRFCYYEGLAYSEDAFVLMVGDNTVTSTVSTVQERLLRCHRESDGTLKWRPQSTFSTNN